MIGFWEAALLLNATFGILTCYYYAKQQGEILIADLMILAVLFTFGILVVWSYIYDEYTTPITKFFNSCKHIGKKPLWRSKSTIAKEVLYGEKK